MVTRLLGWPLSISILIHMHTYIHICIHVCISVFINCQIYTYICVRVHMYIYMHTYLYMYIFWWNMYTITFWIFRNFWKFSKCTFLHFFKIRASKHFLYLNIKMVGPKISLFSKSVSLIIFDHFWPFWKMINSDQNRSKWSIFDQF